MGEQAHSESTQRHAEGLERVHAATARLMDDVSTHAQSHAALRREMGANHEAIKSDIEAHATHHATHAENHAVMQMDVQRASSALESHAASIQERVQVLEQKVAELQAKS